MGFAGLAGALVFVRMANPADGDGASFVAQNDSPDYVVDQPVQSANSTQQPTLNLTKMELGEAIRDGRISNSLSGRTIEGIPASIALRWEYSNGRIGAQWSCLFDPRDGSADIVMTWENKYASGAAWCPTELPRAGIYTVSASLDDERFWSDTITVKEVKNEEQAPRREPIRPSPTPSPLPTAKPVVEKVNCILPDGSQLQLDLSSCRERNGLVYE
jgi:hypothetical protein